MRFINKIAVCKPLQQRRKNKPQSEVSAKKAWRRFNKQAIRKACYKQQFGLCAYTELPLDHEQLGSHLEHIAPRSQFPDRTFEATNLILSIMNDDIAGKLAKHEQFGGHFKQAHYGDDWFISPFDQHCESFFYYCERTGYVYAHSKLNILDTTHAIRTIDTLNLNCDYLVNQRIQHLEDLTESITVLLVQSPDKLKHPNFNVLKQLTLGAKHGKLPIFYSAKKQLLERIEQLHFQNISSR